jgi:Ca2+-binding RTX toxin-like protein
MANFYDRKNIDDHWIGTKKGDVMSGNGGNDVIQGMGGDDYIYGGNGNDRLLGGEGRDYLQGNDGADMLAGGTGADTIAGGGGADELWGGNNLDPNGDGSADWFVFNYAGDSRNGGIDTIMDFHPEEGDVINIGRTVEAYSYNPSYDVHLVADASSVTNDHQQATLAYDATTDVTTLNMYFGDGDPDVDMTLYILGNHTTTDGFLGFYI